MRKNKEDQYVRVYRVYHKQSEQEKKEKKEKKEKQESKSWGCSTTLTNGEWDPCNINERFDEILSHGDSGKRKR